jgi:hypothetical protein
LRICDGPAFKECGRVASSRHVRVTFGAAAKQAIGFVTLTEKKSDS